MLCGSLYLLWTYDTLTTERWWYLTKSINTNKPTLNIKYSYSAEEKNCFLLPTHYLAMLKIPRNFNTSKRLGFFLQIRFFLYHDLSTLLRHGLSCILIFSRHSTAKVFIPFCVKMLPYFGPYLKTRLSFKNILKHNNLIFFIFSCFAEMILKGNMVCCHLFSTLGLSKVKLTKF